MRLQSNPIQYTPALKPKLQNQQTDATVFSHNSQQRTGLLMEETYGITGKRFYDHAPSLYLDMLLKAFPVQEEWTKNLLAKLAKAMKDNENFQVIFTNSPEENATVPSYLDILRTGDKSDAARNLSLFCKHQVEPLEQRLKQDENQLPNKLQKFFQESPEILTQLGLNPSDTNSPLK